MRPPSVRHPVEPAVLLEAASAGDRVSLARLLSLVERGGPPAREVGALVFPDTGRAYTVGITGAPGSGKSTLTDKLIATSRSAGVPGVAVLAVDPSSPFSGGAILGDRVRMQEHALDRGVFIRSMATRGHLGGLSLAVPEAVRVLDAVGVPLVLVETVGVGQVEIEVAGAADTTVVVVTAGWGDAVQVSKAGLLEVADLLVVNKADRPGAKEAALELRRMLEMSGERDWLPPIVSTVAPSGEGVEELREQILVHRDHLEKTGTLQRRRAERLEAEMRGVLVRRLEQRATSIADGADWELARRDLLARRVDPYAAAERILESL